MKSQVSSRLTSLSGSAREICSSALAMVGVFQRFNLCSWAGVRGDMGSGLGRSRAFQEIEEAVLRAEEQVALRVVPVDNGRRGGVAGDALGVDVALVLEHPV